MNVKPFQLEAWKIFRNDDGVLKGLYEKDFSYSVSRTMAANERTNSWTNPYPRSFHAYKSREDARKARKKFGLDNLVIRKVLLSGQIFTGDFYGYEGGYAATEMRVLEDKQ